MIGSRLLFSGYRIGFKGKPLHAGFLGQDVLLVHDEAHLEPAFQKLIEEIESEQRERERVEELPWRKLLVMALTATARSEDANKNNTFELTDSERNPPPEIPDPPSAPLHVAWRRLKAGKTIHFVTVDDEEKIAEVISHLALSNKFKGSNKAILIFVQNVKNVEKIVVKLENERVRQLTGTMRGLERDELPKDTIFARFLPPSNRPQGVTPAEGTVYLVCTSAGEVGVNISADHLICDLTTFESMAQRFGRVNRFGDCTDTEIHVVYPKDFDTEDPYEQRRKKTLDLLKRLNGDASPAALSRLDPKARQAAFAPTPTMLPVTDILFDSWALTTVREKLPGRPPVEPYLHGIAEWQPPETYVGWREEVGLITGELLERYKPQDLLEDYPLKPHELLRDISSRVFDRLKKLKAGAEAPVWLTSDDGSVQVTTLERLIEAGKEELYYRTVLLPPKAGGLENGMLVSDSEHANDVADQWRDDQGHPWRIRVWDDDPMPDGMRLIRTINVRPEADEFEEEGEAPGRRLWHWYERPGRADTEGSQSAQKPVLWQVHTDDVVRNATAIAKKLLPEDLRQAVILAARWHDFGKRRKLWQRDIGNPQPENRLAKSGGRMRPRDLSPFRHEFGSLLDVESEPEFLHLSNDMKDLVLHLIAAHHGRGRPHFPQEEVFDPEPKGRDAAAIAAEVPRRFARMQRKYGRWGLAYLESLLRAADYAASANPSAFVEDV
jgi:CRISPR-associated endonuclease/helicase Cas3